MGLITRLSLPVKKLPEFEKDGVVKSPNNDPHRLPFNKTHSLLIPVSVGEGEGSRPPLKPFMGTSIL